MRFGLFIPQGWRYDLVGIDPAQHWQVMSDLVRCADTTPAWESVWVYDHFHTTPKPSHEATHEAWSLMAGFAAVTSRVRLGQMCTCMSYREPTYLAKVAATIDHISGGRVEMGIGGGWYEQEWRAYGYGFPPAGERLGRLREGVDIFRQAWTTGSATLDGKYYQVDGALCHPQPLQTTSAANRIPIWVAGGGPKVTLKIAAQYADYTNYFGDPEQFAEKTEILKGHCRDVGRDFDEITLTGNTNVVIADNDAELDDKLGAISARMVQGGMSDADARAHVERSLRDQATVGTAEQVAEALRSMKDAGLGYTITYFPDAAYDRGTMERFEREIIPELAD
ncbi:LLM class F420-dependent oxidoreductase [Flexivirga endophytica]|uniref:LLM class F420-dependent oxidoreductase n=1 Tax=Flexivirga endophytica TaxID=1849103 RepID=A0A916TCF9_9MICO|nr:LLM class F420-dependent oxidoreductase [Flexivirga endophytica]GGB38756.1 LLM class F420-dependent oxidoreductase [Flexivirga endophytica]GHB46750.1 LLM class F420-dependent oxidoreductase [Flexivirga endophytica]